MKIEFTKEMLKEAFLANKRKRNFMLFKVYESVFSYDHTAEFIADYISKDLGIPISKSTIDMTRFRVGKKIKSTEKETKKVKPKSVKVPESLKKEEKSKREKEENFGSSAAEIIPVLLPEKFIISELTEREKTIGEKTSWRDFKTTDTQELEF
jgi:predicted DNA-binding protein YlxM (UPF0122 family)